MAIRIIFDNKWENWHDFEKDAAEYFDTSHQVFAQLDSYFLSFFLIRGGTRSLRMPALRPASQAGPVRNPRERTSVVLRDTIRLT